MTIKETIETFDSIKPNTVPYRLKYKWLNDAEDMLYKELIKPREGAAEAGYVKRADRNDDTSLCFTFPYDEVYYRYLSMKTALYHADVNGYNRENALYTAEYNSLLRHYDSEHKPLKKIAFFNA